MTSLSTITFYNHELITTEHNNKPYVAMKPIVEAIGLQWEAQYKRIQRHPVLSAHMSIMNIRLPTDTQRRKVAFLPIDHLNGWLFGVDAVLHNLIRPKTQPNLKSLTTS